MKYIIKCWIPVEDEMDKTIFNNIEDAEEDLKNLEQMQPENKYEIQEIEDEIED